MNKFRIYFNPCFGSESLFQQEFKTLHEAESAILSIATYTLFLHDEGLMPDHTNYSGIEHYVDGEWIDFQEDSLDAEYPDLYIIHNSGKARDMCKGPKEAETYKIKYYKGADAKIIHYVAKGEIK